MTPPKDAYKLMARAIAEANDAIGGRLRRPPTIPQRIKRAFRRWVRSSRAALRERQMREMGICPTSRYINPQPPTR